MIYFGKKQLIPIGDDNSDRRITPFVNYLLILANIFVFIFYQDMGYDALFTYAYSTVPAEILTGRDLVTESQQFRDAATGATYIQPGLQPIPVPVWFTLVSSMFMHGGWAHLGSNMLYLAVFGDNLENRLGHFRYIIFYLLTGVIASLTHVVSSWFFGQDLLVPSLGASGAISAVLGGYLRLFPTRRVHVIIIWFITSVPAVIVLGLWILLQIVSGVGVLGATEPGGIAYAAHIGGFIAGLFLIRLFDRGEIADVRARGVYD